MVGRGPLNPIMDGVRGLMEHHCLAQREVEHQLSTKQALGTRAGVTQLSVKHALFSLWVRQLRSTKLGNAPKEMAGRGQRRMGEWF